MIIVFNVIVIALFIGCMYLFIRLYAVLNEQAKWLREWRIVILRLKDTKKKKKFERLVKKCDRFKEAMDYISFDSMMWSTKPISFYRDIFRKIIDKGEFTNY